MGYCGGSRFYFSIPDTVKSVLPEHIQGRDNFLFERELQARGFSRIAGCDEVGRGCLAGPVVAAAVILPPESEPSLFLDSKILTHKKRLLLNHLLSERGAQLGIGRVAEHDIDRLNILQASLLAMKFAVDKLVHGPPDYLLVDGKFSVPTHPPQLTLIKGETKSASIAAASIVAKITRDQFMVEMHEIYPQYNFAANKGYPTREHRAAIARYGPCPLHRRSFNGVSQYA